MKNALTLLTLCLGLVFISCKDNSSNINRIQQSQQTPAPDQTPPPSSSVNSSVEHYICPNGHVGSGGPSAGTCSQCGATLEHNAAYHNNPSTVTTPSGNNQLSPIIQQPGDNSGGTQLQVQPPPVNTAEPAQNAAGVWHYTCSNGCSGGAGSAGTCSQCGGALAHNAAYHN